MVTKNSITFDTSLVLEGMTRNASTHAAGIIIVPGELTDFIPMYKTPSTDLMTQFPMKDIEEAGLLKMDFGFANFNCNRKLFGAN